MHRIRRQILDIELPSEAGADIWQQRISRVYQEQVLPRLDAVFSRLAPPDRFVRIDHLEIDAGLFNDIRWEARFTEECVKQITQKVAEAVSKSSAAEPEQSETLGAEERMVEIFRHFLETGRLPWFAPNTPLSEIEEMLPPLIRNYPKPFASDFLPILRRNKSVLQRLIWQFSPTLVNTALETAMELAPGWLERAGQILQGLLGRELTPDEKTAFLGALLHFAPEAGLQRQAPQAEWLAQVFYDSRMLAENSHTTGKPPQETDTSGSFIQDPTALAQIDASESYEKKPAESGAYPPVFASSGKAHQEQHGPADKDVSPSSPEAILPPAIKRPAAGPVNEYNQARNQGTVIPTSGIEAPGASKPATTMGAVGMLFNHAGLALLSVYLPAFFEALKLTDGKAFTDVEQQYRGAHLLHFLACGQENPEEPYLVLPKILCGLSVDEPVPLKISLRETEKTEAANLLEAVVRNWPVLKNTSPDGLRQTFLQRPGLLSWSEGRMAWLLRVERRAQDLLLDRLPWGYSVIRLPWMPAMLQVEW